MRVGPAGRSGHDLDLPSVAGGGVDRGGDVQLVGGALAHEGPQPAQRHLQLTDVQGHVRAVAPVAPRVGDVASRLARRREDAVLRPPAADPAWPNGEVPPGPDPVGAAVVALGLLAQPRLELGQEGVEVGQGVVGGVGPLGPGLDRVEPLAHLVGEGQHAAVLGGEGPVEGVEVALVVDQGRAGDVVVARDAVAVRSGAPAPGRGPAPRSSRRAPARPAAGRAGGGTSVPAPRPAVDLVVERLPGPAPSSAACPRYGVLASMATASGWARRSIAIQSISSLVEGFLRTRSMLAHRVEGVEGLGQQRVVQARVVHLDDARHQLARPGSR